MLSSILSLALSRVISVMKVVWKVVGGQSILDEDG